MKAVGIAALAITLAAGSAYAADISTKKMQVKMHEDPAKKQFQVFSKDAAVLYTQAVAPGVDGASIHIYSASDDLCYVIPGDADLWTDKTGKSWKYKNKVNKNQVQIANGKLQVKIRSGVALNLSNPELAYNVTVLLGDAGVKLCMSCSGLDVIRDDEQKFQGKDCDAVPCAGEPPGCDPNVTTTSTSTSTSTTLPALPGTILKAVLSETNGAMSYAMTSGVPGANSLCNTTFPGSHACSATELLAAESAGDLDNIRDVDNDVVTEFWAIDPLRPEEEQCVNTIGGGGTRWFYATAHIESRGDKFPLNNATGDLGALTMNNGCSQNAWVGCCQ